MLIPKFSIYFSMDGGKNWTYWDDEEYEYEEAKEYIKFVEKEISKGDFGPPEKYRFGVIPTYQNARIYMN